MRKSIAQEHVCQYCGKKFKARAGAKYCSDSCRNLASKTRKQTIGALKQAYEEKMANKSPITHVQQQVGTIPQQRELTLDEAKQQAKELIYGVGTAIAIDWIFNISGNSPFYKKKRRRR